MYGRTASVYGPYGGYGRSAGYNPETGAYTRGEAMWDSDEIAGRGVGYNPRTGTGVATNRYAYEDGGWGESLITQGDRWVYTESEWTENTRWTEFETSGGATGEVNVGQQGNALTREAEITRGDQSISTRSARSEQGAVVDITTGEGQNATLARDAASGDLYAASDGDVYRRTEDGNWSQHDGETWQPVEVPEERAQQFDQARSDAQARAGTAAESRGSAQPDFEQRLNPSRERQATDRSRSEAGSLAGSSSSRSRSMNSSRANELNRSHNARSRGYSQFNSRRGAGGGRLRRR